MSRASAESSTSRSPSRVLTGVSDGWSLKTAAYWREVCRGLDNAAWIKSAELGGEPQTPFEVAFSNLAHSYLRDRAPNLLQYELGFQLIEKSNDNTRAVGIFGFKVGGQWLYAPVFFLNGDLKGHELLYLKSQDLFVPLKDNWINYLLGRKPSLLGRAIDRNLSQIGVQSPDLQRLSRSPKSAAARPAPGEKTLPDLAGWFEPILPTFAGWATTKVAWQEEPLFLKALRDAGRPGFAFLEKLAATYPTVYQACVELYGAGLEKVAREVGAAERRASSGSLLAKLAGPLKTWSAGEAPPRKMQEPSHENGGVTSFGRDAWNSVDRYVSRWTGGNRVTEPGKYFAGKKASLLDRLKHANDAGDKKGPDKRPGDKGVEVILRRDVAGGDVPDIRLTDDDRRQLAEEGKVVRDTRADSAVTRVYNLSTSLKLFNPDETNVYEVLVRPDRFERCLVVMAPYGTRGRRRFCTVVSLASDDRWLNVSPARIFCRTRLSREAWNEWFDGLEDAESLPKAEASYRGTQVLLLGRRGQGTCPLRAYEKFEGHGSAGGDGSVYAVNFDDHTSYLNDPPRPYRYSSPFEREEYETAEIETVRLTGTVGTKLRAVAGQLYVPLGFKRLTVAEHHDCCSSADGEKKPKEPLQPGSVEDALLALKVGLTPLELWADDSGVTVNGKKLDKEAAFRNLVVGFGLRADTAELLLKEADEGRRTRRTYHLKLAGPFLTESQPSAPGLDEPQPGTDPVFNSGLPTQIPYEQEKPVDDLIPDPVNRQQSMMGPDPQSMQMAQRASQTGQKEVFDTAMLGSLLKSVRQDTMVDRYLGDLMKGMDRKGRIYYQFLWHGEEFEERYGKQDLPELEDALRNAFEADGDLILVLKRKGVDPFAEEGSDIDLGPIANQ